jgi:hypothetical protein
MEERGTQCMSDGAPQRRNSDRKRALLQHGRRTGPRYDTRESLPPGKRAETREFLLSDWLRCSGCEKPQAITAVATETWALAQASAMYACLRVAADG